jgi:hypothetical protein
MHSKPTNTGSTYVVRRSAAGWWMDGLFLPYLVACLKAAAHRIENRTDCMYREKK